MWRCEIKLGIYWIVIEFIFGESVDFEVYGESRRGYYLIKFCYKGSRNWKIENV